MNGTPRTFPSWQAKPEEAALAAPLTSLVPPQMVRRQPLRNVQSRRYGLGGNDSFR
jgi:hypothetical protein